jgi:hypothetical protein
MNGYFTAKDLNIESNATPAQAAWFAQRGLDCPATKADASRTMREIIAREETKPASQAQLGKSYTLGINMGWPGKELPGAGVREVSTQIYLLEAVENVQRMVSDDSKTQDDVDGAVKVLIGRCLERLAKPMPVERRVGKATKAGVLDAMPEAPM